MIVSKRLRIAAGSTLLIALAILVGLWVLLAHQPDFYRAAFAVPVAKRHAEAKKFLAQSMQLRNDIVNEPVWEAAFSDEEVNAWLAEDLLIHFADRMPPGVHEPRVSFERDRMTLAFQLDQGMVRSVVWVVVRAKVVGDNKLALTIEKIRAGAVPIPSDQLLDRITENARSHGLDVVWEKDDGLPMAVVRYSPSLKRRDIVLERLQVLQGQIRLGGRSKRSLGVVAKPTLPSRRVLQSTFPGKKKDQSSPVSRHNSATPLS